MLGIINNCMGLYKQALGEGPYLTLFMCTIMYVILDKNVLIKKIFLGHTIVFAFIYWCPVTAYIIGNYCIGYGTYWRMFWILPVTMMIAYVLTKIFDHADNGIKKIFLFITIVFLILDCGSRIYNPNNFQPASNPYKLNQAVVDAADIIRAHADANGVEDVGVLPADGFVVELRQYDAGIRMPYGRDMLRGHNNNKTALAIFNCINASETDAKMLKKYAKKGNYQYLICPSTRDVEALESVGYTWIGESYDYYIFYIKLE